MSSLRSLMPVMAIGMAVACGCASRSAREPSGSVGRTNAGRLINASRLTEQGASWIVPPRWQERGALYGVEELVGALRRAANEVRVKRPRARLGVADLSVEGGGSSRWHRSHESGRDVDLLFYTVGPGGGHMPPPEHDMIRFDGQGHPVPREGEPYSEPQWTERRFDPAANWDLVEALLSDPTVRVQRIFVADPLKALLLDHARREGRPEWIVRHADLILLQPSDSNPHDDHFHVRVYCPRADRVLGCEDTGPVWHHEKKAYKYLGPERYDPVSRQWLLMPPVRAVR